MKVKEKSEKAALKLNIQKTKIIASSPITSWQIDGKMMKTVRDFILGGSKITADGDGSHKIKRHLLLGRKAMTNLNSVQSLSHVWFFVTPWTAACQASLSITNSWNLPKLMSTELVMPSNHLILCHPLLPPSIFPSIRESHQWVISSHHMAKVLEFQTSVLPKNTQDQSPLGWTDWISLQPKRLSRVFYNMTIQNLQFFGVQLSSLSSFTFIKRFFNSTSLSAIRVLSSAHLRLLIFLPATLMPVCASSSPVFLMMYSAHKLKKQGDNIQP